MNVVASSEKLKEQARKNALKRLKVQFNSSDELRQLDYHLSKNLEKKVIQIIIFSSLIKLLIPLKKVRGRNKIKNHSERTLRVCRSMF